MLGGIDAGSVNQFTGGLDSNDMKEMTADEIAASKATDFIRPGAGNSKFYDPEHAEHWVVDFVGIAMGFLYGHPASILFASMTNIDRSHRMLESFEIESIEDVQAITAVMQNFLNYLLLHDVCPEYVHDIHATKDLCLQAEDEVMKTIHVRKHLPGRFNIAASALYGGLYSLANVSLAMPQQDTGTDNQWIFHDPQVVRFQEADRTFKSAIALTGTDDLFQRILNGLGKITRSERKALEVVNVQHASSEVIKRYQEQQGSAPEGVQDTTPVGRLICRPWEGPGFHPQDRHALDTGRVLDDSTTTVWLEEIALAQCFVGMKLEMTLHHTDTGLVFFDVVHGVYCSFFTYLPNEKMAHWREPLPTTRLPPTVNMVGPNWKVDDLSHLDANSETEVEQEVEV